MSAIDLKLQVIRELKLALDFYSSDENYIAKDYGYAICAPIELDKGKRAKQALKNLRMIAYKNQEETQ